MSNSRYPYILFFRHYKYASIDNFIESNKDAFMCSFHIINDVNELNKLYNPNYHILITYGNYEEYQYYILPHIPSRFCKRWIHKQDISNIEEFNKHVNYCYISNVIDNRENTRPVFSIFTTCYKSYEYINTAYESIKKQTLKDWEWVIMDDTPEDEHFTFLKKTLANDNRVRLYKRDKNSGNIGNVKNEVISLCRGKYILEMDHDDEILKDCLSDSFHIFESDPEVGFVYGDTINLFRNGQHSMYGENLCKGYSGYYSECINNYWGYVYNTPNVNNITLSHLTCLPNHPRIWKRSVLMELESYSEFLPICDDYEILLRTCCSKYKVVKNNKAQYIQYMNDEGNNFSTIRNAEINRIGPVYISPMFYEKYGVHDKMKQLDAYENPIYITHHSDIWKRGPEYQHKRMNSRINMDYNKQYCIINDAIDNDRLKELYNNDKNDFLFLSNKLTLPELWSKLNSLGFYRMKCYSYKDCTEQELVNFFHMMYKNDNCDYEIIWKNKPVKLSNKIGIFNSFPFHYEIFGFILNYAKNNDYEVDIYTNTQNNMGWIDFYNNNFNNFNIIDYKNFNGNTSQYSYYFISTDDDPLFKSEWISNNVICLNHYYKIRTLNHKHYLNIARFCDSSLDYVYPCYNLNIFQNKAQNNTVNIIGGWNGLNFSIVNRLHSNNKIKLNIFVRNSEQIKMEDMSILDKNKFDIHFKIAIDTTEMIDELNKSSYIFINYNDNNDHNTGRSCSGSMQLALSTLCKPIMAKTANKYLQIENALEFDIDSDEPINIDDEIDFKAIEQERNKYVNNFEKYLNNIKQSYNFEHDKVNISLLDNIKDYKSIYQNYMNRGNTEIMFRKLINYIMPYFKDKNIIDLGAYIGDNSIPWALKSNGIIYAIDPSKENTDFIDKMTKHNKLDNIVSITKAISDISEIIYYNENDDTHISCNNISGRSSFEATTLDSLNFNNIGFIHLDVEGFEYKVLQGAIKIINRDKPIIAWENHIEKEDYMKIVNFLNIHNYNTFLINEQFPHCFPDCRNFISFQKNSNIDINNINNIFQGIYKEFTPDKNRPFLINVNDDINKENLCLLTYGELRTFKNNFRNNLSEFLPILQNYKNTYIFILLDEKNYVRDKYYDYIENICKEFNIKIGFLETMETSNINKQEEKDYCNKLLLQKNNHNKQFPNNFVLNLLYRKYKLIELVEQYCFVNKLDISDILYARVFDCIIKQNIPSNDIYLNIKNTNLENNIYFSPDTTFIGNHKLIKKVIKYDKIYNCDELWNNIGFRNFSYKFDSILTNNKDTYAPEIQYTANIYFQSINAYNLRYYRPDPNCLDKNLMYEIILDPNRHNTIKLDSNNIPKKLFQSWETTNIEPEFQKIIDKWKEFNPDYEYIFHDSEQRLKFIEENFEENVVNAYNKIIPGAYKCDLWRYCILYIYGGFYADIDTLCTGKLNDLTSDNIDFIVPIDLNLNPVEGFHNLACGFFGSIPNSPILLDAINRIVFNVENNIIPESKLDFSGPGVLGRAVNKFLKLEETSSFKGKEGIKNSIKFLHFDSDTEYISDINTNKIILQNKNKNSDIIRLYNNECNKINGFKSWTWTSVSPI
jgi:FkbM family methyltransferase